MEPMAVAVRERPAPGPIQARLGAAVDALQRDGGAPPLRPAWERAAATIGRPFEPAALAARRAFVAALRGAVQEHRARAFRARCWGAAAPALLDQVCAGALADVGPAGLGWADRASAQ